MRKISLDDKYALNTDRAYLTGIEALVRLPIVQHQRDLDAGLNTAGFVTGYRGSPVGSVDQSLHRAQRWLQPHRIHFQPGVNEDLAATAAWGTQQVHLLPQARYDGVFALWYGKGPGLDRSMDVLKHANAFGTTRHGGVLAVAGDDHACKSSTLPHQSEYMFIAAAVPVLSPMNVQEVLDYGIYGWALSRYSGCWVGLKAITENMDSAMSADIDPNRVRIRLPDDFELPAGGLNAQWPTTPLEQEKLLHGHRIYAARAFALANNLNQITLDSPHSRLGIVTSGKSHLDVMEALDELGIDQSTAAEIGLRVYKVGMSWPLEPVATHAFARGLKEILVVEEKRSVIEDQITGQLYNWPVADRPVVVGEYDEQRRSLVSNLGELTPGIVTRALGRRILRFHPSRAIEQRLEALEAEEKHRSTRRTVATRTPYFCSGCPHNTSTRVPDGSIGLAGIGCHYMVKWMDRKTELFTQMGGEGASWIGQAPFTDTRHVFQNIGDGTYFHSGILAIRAAIAAGVNITYKILYNDAVAMTGGQAVDGTLTLADLVAQLQAEGVKRLAVVAEDLAHARRQLAGFDRVTLHPRQEFDQLQSRIREVEGTSVIVFDQTCAAEKRRRRKRGQLAEGAERVFINAAVCEGCGDCSKQSNCLSVLPKTTEAGLKRQIDQHACNQDLSCLNGFCPSFVTVTGATRPPAGLPPGQPENAAAAPLAEPQQPTLERPWNVLITGIGGTGVLTVGALLAMAAHIDGKGCSTLNQTGLAQKFGAVVSHVRIAARQQDILAVRIADGRTDVLLGCDLVVSAMPESLARLGRERTRAVVNQAQTPTADFIHADAYAFPAAQLQQLIQQQAVERQTHFVNATRIAGELLGDAIGANLLLLGHAWQHGLIPLSRGAIEQAIRLNGVAVEFNLQAFELGRRSAANPQQIAERMADSQPPVQPLTALEDIVQWRKDYLTAYQDRACAQHYGDQVERVRVAESAVDPGSQRLSLAVAAQLFRLMAYKDEYEIARLYSNGEFERQIKAQFGEQAKIEFHLAPPLLSKVDPFTGHLRKRRLPGVSLRLFKLLARLKPLRGTRWDLFGRSEERRAERALIGEYQRDIAALLAGLNRDNLEQAVQLAALPEVIKGFGHIKIAAIETYRTRRTARWQQWQAPAATRQ